ncbi:MAG: hypothetical protein ABJF01_24770 [bacterium]
MRIINDGNFLASFNIVGMEIGIEFRDVRLLKGKTGAFAASPFRSYKDKKDETKYINFFGANYDFEAQQNDETGLAYMQAMTQAAADRRRRVWITHRATHGTRKSMAIPPTPRCEP